MKSLAGIREELVEGQYEFTGQAFRQAVELDIDEDDIRHVGEVATIIEECSTDNDNANCMLAGSTRQGVALRILVTRGERFAYKCQSCGCPNSHGELVDEIFNIGGKFTLVERIPSKVCSLCGDRLFSPMTANKLQYMLRKSPSPIRSTNLVTFDY